MSKAEGENENRPQNIIDAGLRLGFTIFEAPLKLNPLIDTNSSKREDKELLRGDDWRLTRREIEILIDEGVLDEPEDYGFSDVGEMKRYLRGRHPESDNSFRTTRSDREEINEHSPTDISIDQTMRSFASAFYEEEAQEAQQLLESTAETDYWELPEDYMVEVIETFGSLVTDQEAELELSAGEEEISLTFDPEEGLFPEVVQAEYRTDQETYHVELNSRLNIPEELDKIPRTYGC